VNLPDLLLFLLFALLVFGLWGVVSGIRASRRKSRDALTPAELSGLAQPYRALIGEALAVQRDVAEQVGDAPAVLRRELEMIAERVSRLVRRALPRARHGTKLAAYLLELEEGEPQYRQTVEAADKVEKELSEFLDTLKLIRGKMYQVLTDASSLKADKHLSDDLQEALIDVDALEEAFGDVGSGLT